MGAPPTQCRERPPPLGTYPLSTYLSRYPAPSVPTSLGIHFMGLGAQGGTYLWGRPGVSVVRALQGGVTIVAVEYVGGDLQ